jgi:hypothetical protein
VAARQARLQLDPEWDRFGDPDPKVRKADGPEELFASQCRSFKLPPFERQLLFAKAALGRRWAFDFAWRQYMVAVEIEGLVPQQIWKATLSGPAPIVADERVANVRAIERQFVVLGRHASIAGIIEDMEKYNSAALLGWTVLRFPQKYVKPKHAIEMTIRVLTARGWTPAA